MDHLKRGVILHGCRLLMWGRGGGVAAAAGRRRPRGGGVLRKLSMALA